LSRRFLFFFLDGVGLGENNPGINPFAKASMPCLNLLLEGKRLVANGTYSEGDRFSMVPLDACLGVEGMPQSATGQAMLLTGRNLVSELGYHYGPKPNPEIARIITEDNLFIRLNKFGKRSTLLNAYPQRFFESVQSGRRLLSAIPLAVTSAGLKLKTTTELFQGLALSADFTGKGWRDNLGINDMPLLSPFEAGKRLARLATLYDFSFFEYWMSDYGGHAQEMPFACSLLEEIDAVLCGLLSAWNDSEGLIFITSDHGNLEDLSTHRHTYNCVPGLVIGNKSLRMDFIKKMEDLTDVTPAILSFFENF